MPWEPHTDTDALSSAPLQISSGSESETRALAVGRSSSMATGSSVQSFDNDINTAPSTPAFDAQGTSGLRTSSRARGSPSATTPTHRLSTAVTPPPSAFDSPTPRAPSALDLDGGDGESTAGLSATLLPHLQNSMPGMRGRESEQFAANGYAENPGPVGSADTEKGALAATARRRVLRKQWRTTSRKKRWCLVGVLVLFIVAVAVGVSLGVVLGKKGSSSSSSGVGSSGPGASGATSGGDGSTVTTEDGTTFIYNNPFGGFWVDNPEDPFDNSAQPNSWTPPLNQTWQFGVDKIYGVNLGGLFVLEPFIVPALFEKYENGSNTVIDEWTLSEAMAADTSAGGGLSQIEDHYNTFITEQDIAQMAGVGLNWIRLPIPFWAIDKWDTSSTNEPFLAQTSWKYILRVLRWARKYGMRVNIDLHTAPGSQNGFNHSGKEGQVNFLNGIMGYANAQRMLGYIRTITEFISQPEYQQLIPMFGIINEALTGVIGQDIVSHFYLQAYDMIRNITGIGEGHGAFIGIHDGFESLTDWADFFPGSDRINLDTHPYFAFGGVAIDPSVAAQQACLSWGSSMNQSMEDFGMTIAGEFSNGINDCGLYLNGVPGGGSNTADCNFWNDITQWNDTIKADLKQFALASMDALQNWFFWTWKIGNATNGTVQAPLWSYQLGLENDFMPTDPRSAIGMCASLTATGTQFDGTFSAWQTGGSGAGTISQSVRESFTAWPPSSMSGVSVAITSLPTYTSTVTVATLPTDTFTDKAKTVSEGDGWADASDTASGVTEVAGCSYPSAWMALGLAVPTSACTGGQTFAARDAIITPTPTAS